MITNADPNTPFPLNPIGQDGQLPKSRLDNANVAQQIFWNLHQSNLARNNFGAYLQGVCDGNPPYRQSSLRSSGQGWRANFSERESEARKNAGKTPFYDLFSAGPSYADVRTSVRDGPLDADSASGIITEEWHQMLVDWSGFDLNVWMMLDSFVGFGRGWIFWPQTDVWHFKRIPWWRVRFPDGTGVDVEDWSLFSIEHSYDPVTLNGYIRDESSAKTAGWNVERVRKALKNATPVDPQFSQDQMLVQQMIKDQDIQLMYRSSTVQAASIFVKEFDGTWSRMVVETGKTSNSDLQLGAEDWLFYKRGVADDIRKIIAPFIFEVATGSINGLSGILETITDQVKTKNRLRCEQINNGFLRSTVLMQAGSASSRVKNSMITVGGGVTLIPEGMTVQQSTVLGDVSTANELIQEMERTLDTNTGVFRPQMEKPSGNPEPLGTTQLRYAQAAVLTSSAVNRFQQQLDWFYTELYRRSSMALTDSKNPAIKAARAFQKRCRDRGVTDKQLRDVEVRAVRVIGNGSPAMRSQLTAEMGQVAPQFGQRGRLNWLRDFVAARGGQTKVDRYLPIQDAVDLPTQQDREALEENAVVKIGSPVVVVENDDHIVHLKHHFEAAQAALQAAQQGGQAHDAAAFIQGIMPHIQEHIQALADPKMQKQAIQMLKQLEGGYKQLVSEIQQAQPDPQQQAQVMSDIQLKQLDTQSRIQDRNVKTQAALRDKAVKTQAGLQLQSLQAQQRMGLDDAQVAAKIRRETALAASKVNGEE